MNSKIYIWAGGVVVVALIAATLAWFLFLKPVQTATPAPIQGLGAGTTQTTGVSSPASSGTTNQVTNLSQGTNKQKVFKIADGPVSGATFTQTFSPTTTLARYVLAENGHVVDQPIDVPGSLPRTVSNTTIPATGAVLWGKGGSVAVFQYQDSDTTKTLSLVIPSATSSKSVTKPVEIQFLPDNIRAVALAPSGSQVAYLTAGTSGSDGYIANIDGSSVKKIFSVGFSQLLLSWPSPNTLLLSTKSAAGVPGMIFSIDTKTGNIVPLVYASGLTAMANASFSYMLYQDSSVGAAPVSYARDMQKAGDIRLSFNPIPEKCVSSSISSSTIYCATPATYFDSSYLDAWHQGAASLPDTIVSFMFDKMPDTSIVARPGVDGGAQSDILEMAVSADDKYLLFIKKGDRSLWAVRLGQ